VNGYWLGKAAMAAIRQGNYGHEKLLWTILSGDRYQRSHVDGAHDTNRGPV